MKTLQWENGLISAHAFGDGRGDILYEIVLIPGCNHDRIIREFRQGCQKIGIFNFHG